jgi:hypothetical protein
MRPQQLSAVGETAVYPLLQVVDGMSFAVGQGHDTFYNPDRLYVLLTLPPEPHTFKVVIGWRDHDNRGDWVKGQPVVLLTGAVQSLFTPLALRRYRMFVEQRGRVCDNRVLMRCQHPLWQRIDIARFTR